MDANYLSRLVHPINKTPLRFDEQSGRLTDTVNKDQFEIKDNVPILLNPMVDSALSQTELHSGAGSSFQYKEHYQQDAATYDYFKETENATEKEEHERLHEYIMAGIPAGAEWILDTGCGGGWLAKALKPRNLKVISMDISDINPIRATKDVPYQGHYGLVADVFELPIKEGSVDCIVASEIIEHVPDPKRFINSLFNALKPGGRIIITTPYNEKIQYSLCIHCNRLTPHNAHLHSFTQASFIKFLPDGVKTYSTRVFNNKILVRLGLQRIFGFLPLPAWKLIDNLANALTNKRAYRLMVVIDK
jgi:2-polyprenyl-3-methyl-5-hydroxy-6-metoxy-1,4-benzoquinol methylase